MSSAFLFGKDLISQTNTFKNVEFIQVIYIKYSQGRAEGLPWFHSG